MSEGYDPNRSRVAEAALATFLASPVSDDIQSVPGIGPAAANKLAVPLEGDSPVTTTYQLIGKFLTLKGKETTQKEHCDAMWYWLQERGVSSHRAGIVQCIAEKCNIMIPGIYDHDVATATVDADEAAPAATTEEVTTDEVITEEAFA